MGCRMLGMINGNTTYDKDYTEYQHNRSWLRKRIRRIYLRHVLLYVKGKTIDLGCGVGELLTMLPSGSVGFEINEATVRYCRGMGLPVTLYDPFSDGYRFSGVSAGAFTTVVMAHVLEHLDDSAIVLRTILQSCFRLGIERVIIIVPGPKGFRYDKTHRTFINRQFFTDHVLDEVAGYRITTANHFPLPFHWVGNFFAHNELTVVYERITK